LKGKIVWDVGSPLIEEKRSFLNGSELPVFRGGLKGIRGSKGENLLRKFVGGVSFDNLGSQIDVVDSVNVV
jgi:hypothetical protein